MSPPTFRQASSCSPVDAGLGIRRDSNTQAITPEPPTITMIEPSEGSGCLTCTANCRTSLLCRSPELIERGTISSGPVRDRYLLQGWRSSETPDRLRAMTSTPTTRAGRGSIRDLRPGFAIMAATVFFSALAPSVVWEHKGHKLQSISQRSPSPDVSPAVLGSPR